MTALIDTEQALNIRVIMASLARMGNKDYQLPIELIAGEKKAVTESKFDKYTENVNEHDCPADAPADDPLGMFVGLNVITPPESLVKSRNKDV